MSEILKSSTDSIAAIYAKVMAGPKMQAYGAPWKTMSPPRIGVRLASREEQSLPELKAPAA